VVPLPWIRLPPFPTVETMSLPLHCSGLAVR